jgi:hypothetical protein
MYDSGRKIFTYPGVTADLPVESGGKKCGDTAVAKKVSFENAQPWLMPFVEMKVPRRAFRKDSEATDGHEAFMPSIRT